MPSIDRQHLAAALDLLVTALTLRDAAAIDTAAATVLDMARGLASAMGDETGSDMLYWAEAVCRCLASARRDAALTRAVGRRAAAAHCRD